ncbi:MAG: hypothetical protein XD98_0291 [Microgenomates bacterium 39_6]|nr:MAG: hypothetical protein XD98_0291 [Microgenomates bacterium 39_6]
MVNPEAERKLLIIRPQGVQGSRVGLSIGGQEDIKRLDEEMGKLSLEERQQINNIKGVAVKAKIPIVDY